MKKMCIILIACLLLAGCSARETFETVEDEFGQQQIAAPRQMLLTLPENAAAQTVQSDYGQRYFCDGYETTLQTMSAGNLNATLRQLTGFGADALTVVETGLTDNTRYECVWTAAGEGGDMVGRAVILDDGVYHYCMTAMASADMAAQLRQTWQDLFETFTLG